MKILVTGRQGQVARSLAEGAAADPNIELMFAGRPQFDLLDRRRRVGHPTAATDIADGIVRIAKTVADGRQADRFGIFHLCGGGSTNRAGFARHVFAESARLGGPSAKVEDITAADYPTKARRPRSSRLSCEKLVSVYGWRPPPWQEACRAAVARLVGERSGECRRRQLVGSRSRQPSQMG